MNLTPSKETLNLLVTTVIGAGIVFLGRTMGVDFGHPVLMTAVAVVAVGYVRQLLGK